ncbi:MAG TPA: AAA family ATPase [Candidatus Corynebacterium faecigallinarum]|uniref:AAA family ATPase n=1 Tax=Candidatus Corynebacterium faecigallinarum TaxID=2838528 RepID=A0A9D2TNB1_9CORY|nr:AAA family ATPase [Candidatus Corynebacterium faecigallinarum]
MVHTPREGDGPPRNSSPSSSRRCGSGVRSAQCPWHLASDAASDAGGTVSATGSALHYGSTDYPSPLSFRSNAPLPVRRVEELEVEPADRRSWPATVPAVRDVLDDGLDLARLTVIVGENGSGKSTLVEAIAEAYGLNPEGGTHNARPSTQRTESGLSGNLKLIRAGGASRKGVFLRAETMHGHFAYLDGVGTAPGVAPSRNNFQSHGESFIEYFTDRSRINGLWIFDEAESALSFNGCLVLMAQITTLVNDGCQVIMSTHSPLLASLAGADSPVSPDSETMILELDDRGLHHTDYDDLALVQDWHRFLEEPGGYLRLLE